MRKILLTILLLFTVWVLGFMLFLIAIGSAQPENPDEKTDAIVVLTGGPGRLELALHLLSDGLAEELFISGVGGGATLENLFPDPQEKETVQRLKEKIFIDRAPDTVGNAKETIAALDEKKHTKIRLVTANYHMPRSLIEFSRAAGGNVVIFAHPLLSVDVVGGEAFKTQNIALLLFKEYNKFLVAWLRANISRLIG